MAAAAPAVRSTFMTALGRVRCELVRARSGERGAAATGRLPAVDVEGVGDACTNRKLVPRTDLLHDRALTGVANEPRIRGGHRSRPALVPVDRERSEGTRGGEAAGGPINRQQPIERRFRCRYPEIGSGELPIA